MKFIAIVIRTLKEGKTYEDYRKAWFHSNGFGVPTTMYTVVNAFNPREIISIGILDGQEEELLNALNIDVKDRLANPLDDVIESSIIRKFGMVTAIDDFSPAGALTYIEPQVDGEIINEDKLNNMLKFTAEQIQKASAKRDRLKK
jgi:hypothetical protein